MTPSALPHELGMTAGTPLTVPLALSAPSKR